jgi:hypothetical protein
MDRKASAPILYQEPYDRFVDVSLNQWIRRMPPEMATAHLNLSPNQLAKIPAEKQVVIAGSIAG